MAVCFSSFGGGSRFYKLVGLIFMIMRKASGDHLTSTSLTGKQFPQSRSRSQSREASDSLPASPGSLTDQYIPERETGDTKHTPSFCAKIKAHAALQSKNQDSFKGW